MMLYLLIIINDLYHKEKQADYLKITKAACLKYT